jgi:outer membrane protein assembly factor BamB
MGGETADAGSGGPLRTPWWTAVWWAGVGVLLAGVGVLGYALAVADREYLIEDRAPEPVAGFPLTVVVVAGTTAATLTWVFLALRRVSGRRLPPPWVTAPLSAVPVVGVGLLGHMLNGGHGVVITTVLTASATVIWTYVAAGWVRDSDVTYSIPWPSALVTVALALAGAVVTAFVQWLDLRDATFPGERRLLVTTAYVVMLLGTASVHLAALRLPPLRQAIRLRSLRGVVGFVGGVVVVALVAGVVVDLAGERSRVDATTTAAVPPPPTPADVTRVAWRWSEGEEILAAVPAGAGVVAATSRGVVALDGSTGQERWHYRRDGARRMDLAVVEGGRGVIASFDGRLHAFDAFTGELRWRHEPPAGPVPAFGAGIAATETTVIRSTTIYSDFELAGIDARTGEEVWRYSPPPECDEDAQFVDDMIIVFLGDACSPPGTVEAVALDGSTGQPVWRKLVDDYASPQAHGSVTLSTPDDPGYTYVDPRTGRENAELTRLLGDRTHSVLGRYSDDVLTFDWELFRLGETGPRWQAEDSAPEADAVASRATFLRNSVVILDDRACPGGEPGLELVVLDRDDGTRRRSFDCRDLSEEDRHSDAYIFRASGAVVLSDGDSLIGLSG